MKKIKMWLGVGMAGVIPWDTAKYGVYIMFCTTTVKVIEWNKFK